MKTFIIIMMCIWILDIHVRLQYIAKNEFPVRDEKDCVTMNWITVGLLVVAFLVII